MPKNLRYILLIGFFLSVFVLSLGDFTNDLWLNIREGEVIVKQGIFYHDVFSHAAPNRIWYPNEWLFQVVIFEMSRFLGLFSIRIMTALFEVLLIGSFFLIIRRFIWKINLWAGLFSFSFFALTYEFVVARPALVGYAFFVVNLFFILLYLLENKNWLWLTIPLTLIWTNLHASIFLDVYLFFAYLLISLFYYFIKRDSQWRKKTLVLGFYTLTTAGLTTLPPLGLTQYRVLWFFYQKRDILAAYFSEWTPLTTFSLEFQTFLVILILTCLMVIAVSLVAKRVKFPLWLVPLVPLITSAFMVIRNSLFGYIALILILAWATRELASLVTKRLAKRLIAAGLISVTVAEVIMLVAKIRQPDLDNIYGAPVKAAAFLKAHDFHGNMFNRFVIGSYLVYALYPKYKVFVDSRADVYLCCEIPDLLKIYQNRYLPDDQYRTFLDTIWQKYDISFAVLSVGVNVITTRIAHLLTQNGQWQLVYWDDNYQILVRPDGKNNQIIKDFAVFAATPFAETPFKAGGEVAALAEYQRMIGIADSAISRNAVGFILMREGKFAQAKDELTLATKLDPTFDSSFLNLGELAVHDGNIPEAIRLYQKGLSLDPNRGFIYIRLGELYRDGRHDSARAVDIWRKGLAAAIDDDSKAKIQQLIGETSLP